MTHVIAGGNGGRVLLLKLLEVVCVAAEANHRQALVLDTQMLVSGRDDRFAFRGVGVGVGPGVEVLTRIESAIDVIARCLLIAGGQGYRVETLSALALLVGPYQRILVVPSLFRNVKELISTRTGLATGCGRLQKTLTWCCRRDKTRLMPA